jgi:hypothetical protein
MAIRKQSGAPMLLHPSPPPTPEHEAMQLTLTGLRYIIEALIGGGFGGIT